MITENNTRTTIVVVGGARNSMKLQKLVFGRKKSS
jgi:hypothetical protein